MKDILQDIVAHTHALGFLDLIKVSNDKETVIESMTDTRSVILNAKEKVGKSPLPSWVSRVSYKDTLDTSHSVNSRQYLLVDIQDNLIQDTYYRHYAVKVSSTQAIQSLSDINIDFNPSYEHLSLHVLQIIRDGNIINKIDAQHIQLLTEVTHYG